METDTPAPSLAPAAPRAGLKALFGLALVIAGPFAYMALMGIPWVMSTGLPAFALMVLGSFIVTIAAATDRRLRVRLTAGLGVALTLLFAFAFFVMARIPASEEFAALAAAPDFTLPDEEGRPVSLREAVLSGPVLLVFYRGHW